MSDQPKVGLLPLYIALYDRALPDLLKTMMPFLEEVAEAIRAQGIAPVTAPVCRLRSDYEAAVKRFNEEQVDAIVTLHLAYAPSLEAVDALCAAPQPIIMLDTTPDAAFGRDAGPDLILRNHGIHGLQDLANLLRRRGKPYWVIAGHLEHRPDVMEALARTVAFVCAARRFKSTRALRIGPPLEGMGDFQVGPGVLGSRFGIEVSTIEPQQLAPEVEQVTAAQIEEEIRQNQKLFDVEAGAECHARSARVGLGLRHYLRRHGYTAFSLNFDAFQSGDGPVNTVPFLECSKSMAAGIGYAGEGDVLTASLVGALLSACPQTTFAEMFCPDWTGESLFLSHMGEFNPAVSASRVRLCERDYTLSAARNPVVVAGAPRPGPGTFVNIAPGPDDSFRLIVAPVEILHDTTHEDMKKQVRGWMRPRIPVADFLRKYSELGGTHHGALMLGEHEEGLRVFARLAGLDDFQTIA